jgi:hypothetical protein
MSELSYLSAEILSYLPSGWKLVAGDAGSFDRPKDVFRIQVLDPAEVDWPLEVSGRSVTAHGRVEALRQAMGKLYREALGG